ncbi:ATP-dependent DNA helicase RecG [Candidatus Uhrbacteria bacterium]|nr:ATP-dependent DNA helicase RecG [Candidatus Uhrbacteria bacterium]
MLDAPVSNISGIGKATEKELQKLGITTVRDLIFYLPYRFDDFTKLYAIKDLKARMTATIRGTVTHLQNRRSWRTHKIVTEAFVDDESGSIKVIWFNQPYIVKNIKVGDTLSLSGRTSDNFYDLTLVSPMYEKIISGTEPLHTGRLVPLYSLTHQLHQKQLRSLIKKALHDFRFLLSEYLPSQILDQEKLLALPQALEAIHFPATIEEAQKAKRRFSFEELFILQLCNLVSRKAVARLPAYAISFHKKETSEFISSLPYALTKSQKEAAWEIIQDFKKNFPMNRLLEGDVGSGKTVVGALAVLNAVRSGYQCVLMAPTEILAVQHFETFCTFYENIGVRIALLTSSAYKKWNKESGIRNQGTKKEKKSLLQEIQNGDIDLVVGTHALIQPNIIFKKLALAIIDEQHRFGVAQRKALCEKNDNAVMPHLLSMTATPIPRSLALTVYGDLDISLIHGAPRGRKKIITKIVPQHYRQWVYDFIKKEIAHGRQVFIVCPLIDPSDTLGVRSVGEESKRLQESDLASVRLGVLHGKMKQKEKEHVMSAMAAGDIDVLVTTSVVEVGVDIPRATVMLIEGAERFGLAQLHQFRGRVGRCAYQSYCFLLPTEATHENKQRLKAIVSSNDGFALAEKDLELRGEGDVFGERQSGMPLVTLASLADVELIKKTRSFAEQYVVRLDEYPELKNRVDAFQRQAHFE